MTERDPIRDETESFSGKQIPGQASGALKVTLSMGLDC